MAGTGKAHLRDSGDVLLRVDDLVVEVPVGHTGLTVNAVSGISLDVLRGETELRSANRGDIAAGPAADYHYVEVLRHS